MTLSLSVVQGAYIIAGLLFIMALAGLSRHDPARHGNRFGIVGMAADRRAETPGDFLGAGQ